MARPEKWKDEFVKLTELACMNGATDLDIADMLGVCIRTINYWRVNKQEFAAALKIGKELADTRVERSLYSRATGYSYDTEKVVGGKIVKHREHVPPDPTSMIFWLKNRQPKKWRDRREQEITGADGAPLQVIISKADERL